MSAAPSTISPSAGTRAARPDQDDIARRQLRDRHRLDRPVPKALGLIGKQLGERLQRAARLADRAHLQPVAEQHDHDQRGQLPPELELEQPQQRRGAATKATVIASAINVIIPG